MSGEPTTAKKRRYAPRGTRRQSIIDQAAHHFAEHGFAASTRDLARGMGVTQALLYKYFPSKDALIDQIFSDLFIDRWQPEWDDLIRDRALSLEMRLIRFYEAFLARRSYISTRLFMRAALDGQGFPDRYTPALDDRILRPVMAELRHDSGLPDFAARPPFDDERELALVLHGGIVFLNIRKNIYETPLPDDLGRHVALHVRTFLPGARNTLKALHAELPGGEA